MQHNRIVRFILSALLISLALGVVFAFFVRLPIEGTNLAMDWKGLWQGLKDGIPRYGNETGLRIPPWSVLVVLPLGLFPFRMSWGLVTVLTLTVLILSVPRGKSKALFWLSVACLVFSYPALRTIADGNFEFLVIGGILLALSGYEKGNPFLLAIGYLLAATKIQETWLLLAFFPISVWSRWPRRQSLIAMLIILSISVPALLWRGLEWVEAMFAIIQRGSIMDSSLSATLQRLSLPPLIRMALWLGVFLVSMILAWKTRRSLSREKAAWMAAASLLLAPYAAGNSYLTVYTAGVIPLLQSWWLPGAVLVLLTNLPYLALDSFEILYYWSANYWCFLLLSTWGVLVFRTACLETPGFRPGRKTPPIPTDSRL